jgi:hypothetical protein
MLLAWPAAPPSSRMTDPSLREPGPLRAAAGAEQAQQCRRLLRCPLSAHSLPPEIHVPGIPQNPHTQVVFYLPQLVQLLRGDDDGAVSGFFTAAAAHSDLFAHRLIWALCSEGRPPEEAFNPEVKR